MFNRNNPKKRADSGGIDQNSPKFVLSTASTAPNAPQFDAEKAKVGERNLILLHNSLKEICFLTFSESLDS